MKQLAERMWIGVIELVAGIYLLEYMYDKMQERIFAVNHLFDRLWH